MQFKVHYFGKKFIDTYRTYMSLMDGSASKTAHKTHIQSNAPKPQSTGVNLTYRSCRLMSLHL